jgi:hypothetical protein
VTIASAGGRTLYYEGRGSPTLTRLDVRIVAPDGSALAVEGYSGDLRYDAPDGTVGRAVGTFTAPIAGAYQLTVGETISQGAHLAVGERISTSTIASILGALLLIGATFCAGLIIVTVTAARRSRS